MTVKYSYITLQQTLSEMEMRGMWRPEWLGMQKGSGLGVQQTYIEFDLLEVKEAISHLLTGPFALVEANSPF